MAALCGGGWREEGVAAERRGLAEDPERRWRRRRWSRAMRQRQRREVASARPPKAMEAELAAPRPSVARPGGGESGGGAVAGDHGDDAAGWIWAQPGPDLGLGAGLYGSCQGVTAAVRRFPSTHEVLQDVDCGCSASQRWKKGGFSSCGSSGSSVYHDASATTMFCCGGGGVSGVDGCPIPVSEEGGVRRSDESLGPSSVGASDEGARGGRFPSWRRRRGVSTSYSPSFRFG